MKVIAVGGKIFSVAWEMMGFETFCLNLLTNMGLSSKTDGENCPTPGADL